MEAWERIARDLLLAIDQGTLSVSGRSACPYLPDREMEAVAFRAARLPPVLYDALLLRGFRRSGDVFYRPQCEGCQACTPLRLRVGELRPSRSQRRVWRRNASVKVALAPLVLDDEIYDIYVRYMDFQHPGSPQGSEREELERFLFTSSVDSLAVHFRLDGQLFAVSVVDICPGRSLSSVYHFFAPAQAHRSPGVLSVLWENALAQRMNIPYYYLGYWVPGAPTMDYKARYGPHEILVGAGWCRPAMDESS